MAKKRRTPSRSRSHKSSLSESDLEASFLSLCRTYALPSPTQQHIFHPQRQWRLDFSWPEHNLAVEIQGYGRGHTSYTGMHSDYEKHNQAVLLGWRFLYFMGVDLIPPNHTQTINIVRQSLGITTANPGTTTRPHSPSNSDPKNQLSFLNSVDRARRKLDQIANKKT